MNCKLRWRPDGVLAPASAASATAEGYPFSADELRRLAVYRAAVRARFFSDWLGPEPVTP